jgi:hypothetical protein
MPVFLRSGSDDALVRALQSRGAGARALETRPASVETAEMPANLAETGASTEPCPSRIVVIASGSWRRNGPVRAIGCEW